MQALISFSKATPKLNYRADIDGLRALAVLSVLIYHAGFYWQGEKLLSGGFLGVDIFFVISGYLICGILLKEINAGSFSFTAFYERRARRILPALFFVMLCSAIVAPFLLSPEPLKEFASSVAAAGAFVSNFFFWLQDSYTAEPSLRKPLLHTWSLAVEEQFYLLFPLFLWLIWKRLSGKFMLALAFVAIASLLYTEWGSYYLPSAIFYLLPSRIWELMAGAILALMHLQGRFKQAHGLLAWLGLALVAASLVMFDDTTRHPSLWTLLPVVGTVMMIMAVPASPHLNKLLSSKPMVGIGLVSYSLYLWHQPVFAFDRVFTGSELTVIHKLGLIIVCLLLAVVSWRFVETPFRRADRMSRYQLVRSLGSSCVVLVIFVAAVLLGRHQIQRITGIAPSVEIDIRHLSQDGRPCHQSNDKPLETACALTSGNGEQSWYLVSDCNAGRLGYSLWEYLQDRNASLIASTKDNCPYTPGILIAIDGKVNCSKSDNSLRRKMLLEAKPSTVVISNLLQIYIHGTHNRPHLRSYTLSMQEGIGPTYKKLEVKDIRHHVHQAIKELLEHGHRVVLVYPTHMADFDVKKRFTKLMDSPPRKRENLLASGQFSKSYREFRAFADVAYQIYNSIDDHPNLIRILPEDIFCDASDTRRCKVVDQETSFYTDFIHLSYHGACKLVEAIFTALSLTKEDGSAGAC